MKKTETITCTSGPIAAPGGNTSTTFRCRSLSSSASKKVMNFLKDQTKPGTGGGSIVISKKSTLSCTAATQGAPDEGQPGATIFLVRTYHQ